MTDKQVSTSFPPFRISIIVLQALVLFVLLKYYVDILWPKLFKYEKPTKESHRKGQNMEASTQPYSQTFAYSDKSYLPSGLIWTRARTGARKLWARFEIRRAWNEPLILKFLCFKAMIFTQILRLITSLNYWLADDEAMANLASSPTWILDLCFSICVWLAFEFYTLSILNRFLRVEMILAQSKTYKVIRFIKYSFSIAIVLCVLSDIVEKVIWMYFFDLDSGIRSIIVLLFGIFKSLTGLFSALLEVIVDIRMIFTSLAIHLMTDKSNNENATKKTANFRILKYQMLSLFLLLVTLSFSAVSLIFYSQAKPKDDTILSTFKSHIDFITLSVVLMGYHLLLGYVLMDLFLAQLKSAKKQIKLQRMNQSRTMKAAIQLPGQIPSMASADIDKEYSSFDQESSVASEQEDESVEADSMILLEKRRLISFWDVISDSRK